MLSVLPDWVAGKMYLDDIVSAPFTYRDGSLLAPMEPGLGIDLDMDKVANYRVPG
jgi:muconate cycloisomerase